jgi:excisionase family DNA binding protein
MAPTNVAAKEWLSIHEACALLGVSPATLRRWSDECDLVAFTTPGGHRRFARSTLLSIVPPASKERPSLQRLGGTGEHMTRVLRRNLPRAFAGMDWTEDLSPAELGLLRRHGRTIATALLAGIDTDSRRRRDVAFAEANRAASECGRIAGAHEIGVQSGVDMFLRLRRLFLAELVEVVRRHRLSTPEATDLVVRATAALDDLLLAVLSGYAMHSEEGKAF